MLFILRQISAIQTFQKPPSRSNQIMSTHPRLHLASYPFSLRIPIEEIYAAFPYRTCHMSNQFLLHFTTRIILCVIFILSFIPQAVSQQFHSPSQSEYTLQSDTVLPLSVIRIISFPYGHSIGLLPRLPANLIFPSEMHVTRQLLNKIRKIQVFSFFLY